MIHEMMLLSGSVGNSLRFQGTPEGNVRSKGAPLVFSPVTYSCRFFLATGAGLGV
jgi:hypothetical protein